MIVWSGRGFLSVLVLAATLFLCVTIFPENTASYSLAITAFVTGLFSWFFGKKWNTQNERIVVDEESGQRLKIKNNHTLFWIPMQYWGIIFPVFGIVILFQESIVLGIIAAILLIVFALIPFLKGKKDKVAKPQKAQATKKPNNTSLQKETKNTIEPESAQKKDVPVKEFDPSDHSRFMPK